MFWFIGAMDLYMKVDWRVEIGLESVEKECELLNIAEEGFALIMLVSLNIIY